MATLLEKAQEIKTMRHRRHAYDEEQQELAIAFLRGEVSCNQISKVMNLKGGNIQQFTWGAIVAAYKAGKIIIK